MNQNQQEEIAIQNDNLRLLGEQAAIIIHEVRSPLQAVKAQLQVMQRMLNQQGVDRHDQRIRMIYQELDRLNNLLSQFLLLGGAPKDQLEAVHLPTIAAETVQLLRSLCIKHGVTATVEEPEEFPMLQANEQSVRRVMVNLIVNAAQAMEEPGHRIHVAFHRDRRIQTVVVENDGPSITVKPIETIFEPYFTTKKDGNGLGLYGCRQLAAAHKGSLTVESVPGRTAFFFSLPEEIPLEEADAAPEAI